jgi:hypothetical protein
VWDLAVSRIEASPEVTSGLLANPEGLIAGTKVTTEKQTLPKDIGQTGEMLKSVLPDLKGGGWVLMPTDPVSPSGYYLGYRPRLTGEAPPVKTLDQKASEYQGSKAQQLRNIQLP